MTKPEECIRELFQAHFNTPIISITALAQSGSYRQYFRIKSSKKDVLGVYNTDLQENKAYLSFTDTFTASNIQVPQVYLVSKDEKAYLIEDIGTESLWDRAQIGRKSNGRLSDKSIETYKATLAELLKIQTQTIEKLDLSYCYPRDAFDYQSILWDLNYFKYFFLRLLRIAVDEQKLEEDMQSLATTLDKVDQAYFLYRDFQSRNVMIKDNSPYFIDFQGGRKGAFYYDVASILYDANVELETEDRNDLLAFYYQKLNTVIPTEEREFTSTFHQFAIIRLTQALGAFGLRGVVEKKPNFKECIPYALKALKDIIDETGLMATYPTLCTAILEANNSKYISELLKAKG